MKGLKGQEEMTFDDDEVRFCYVLERIGVTLCGVVVVD